MAKPAGVTLAEAQVTDTMLAALIDAELLVRLIAVVTPHAVQKTPTPARQLTFTPQQSATLTDLLMS